MYSSYKSHSRLVTQLSHFVVEFFIKMFKLIMLLFGKKYFAVLCWIFSTAEYYLCLTFSTAAYFVDGSFKSKMVGGCTTVKVSFFCLALKKLVWITMLKEVSCIKMQLSASQTEMHLAFKIRLRPQMVKNLTWL